MGIWPFGSEPKDVELVSRVVTAPCLNQSKVRGKLTVNFETPVTQRAADDAGDACAAVTEAILAEAKAPIEVLGGEAEVIMKLMRRLPPALPATRIIELASLHVVGMPAIGTRRNSTSRMQAVQIPGIATTPTPSPIVMNQGGGPVSAPISPLVPRRPSSTRVRAISADLILPRGSPPDAIGRAISPLVRDSAARLLIGVLRVHDLLVVRGLTLDTSTADVVDALVPVSDAPYGGFEASRASEIARWQQAIGTTTLDALRAEIAVVTSFLARRAILGAGVSQAAASAVLAAVAVVAFPGLAARLAELDRYAGSAITTVVAELSANIGILLGEPAQAHAMEAALTPVLAAVDTDLGISAMLVKSATG